MNIKTYQQQKAAEFENKLAYKFDHKQGCSLFSDTAKGPMCTCGVMKDALEFLAATIAEAFQLKITEDTSDGYHTFKELYEFRKLYNAALFNEWAKQGKYDVHKSKKHHEGDECFGGGWFIVSAQLPAGQISNHYEMKDWDLFQCDERERANQWDGHTAQDVVKRLKEITTRVKAMTGGLSDKRSKEGELEVEEKV